MQKKTKEMMLNVSMGIIEKQSIEGSMENVEKLYYELGQEIEHLKSSFSELGKTQKEKEEASHPDLANPVARQSQFIEKIEKPYKGISGPSTSKLVTKQKGIQQPDEVARRSPQIRSYWETVEQAYKYTESDTCLRIPKARKYPRYICTQYCNAGHVKKLFIHGFLDKVLVDSTCQSISKLPSIFVKGFQKCEKLFGEGLYCYQIHEACPDTEGKGIFVAQIFKVGKPLKVLKDAKIQEPPCEVKNFEEWMCQKRAEGIQTIINRLNCFNKFGRGKVLGTNEGTAGVEELIVITYMGGQLDESSRSITCAMKERLEKLQHRSAPLTKEKFEEKRKPAGKGIIIVEEDNTSMDDSGSEEDFTKNQPKRRADSTRKGKEVADPVPKRPRLV